MPRDGSGNYTLPVGNPVVTDTIIASDWANDTMEDVATQLNNVLTRDGVLGPLAAFKLIDGTAAVPALAFNSEPGLGLYRVNTSIMGFAAAAKQLEILDASTAGSYIHSLYPRSAGSAEARFNTDVYGTANTSLLQVGQNATNAYLTTLAVGSGTALPIVYTAPRHNMVGPLWAMQVSGNGVLNIDRDTDVAKFGDLNYYTDESKRFMIRYGATGGETGNAGNFSIYRFQNDGVTSENAFNIARADGVATFQRSVTVGAADGVGVNSFICTRQAQFGGLVGITVSGTAINASAGSIFAQSAFGWDASAVPHALTSTSYSLISGGPNRLVGVFNGNSIGTGSEIVNTHNPGVAATIIFRPSTGVDFTMLNSGTGNSTGGWVATSDRRVKTEITPIQDAIGKLLTMGGYTYLKQDMKGMDGIAPRKAGFIAQEIQAVLPEAVTAADDEMGTLSVDHNGVIGLLIEAVKELYYETRTH